MDKVPPQIFQNFEHYETIDLAWKASLLNVLPWLIYYHDGWIFFYLSKAAHKKEFHTQNHKNSMRQAIISNQSSI